MLAHTIPHLGALGINPQNLIDTLVLLNGDNIRVNGDANCHVANDSSLFTHLIRRKFHCTLGLGASSSFEGVGIQVISFPSHPSTFIILSHVYYSPQDDAPTFSTSALVPTGFFKQIAEVRHRHIIFTCHDGRDLVVPVKVRNKLDYVQLRFQRPGPQYKTAHAPLHLQLHSTCWNVTIKENSVFYSFRNVFTIASARCSQ